MLKLSNQQILALSQPGQDEFLKRIIKHLENASQTLNLPLIVNCKTESGVLEVKNILTLLIYDWGFESEICIASAIEYFAIFGVDSSEVEINDLLRNQAVDEVDKLNKLFEHIRMG